MKQHNLKRNHHRAHSLSEYGLVIGLAVIIGIGGLMTLGSQVSGLLGNTISHRPDSQSQSRLASTPQANQNITSPNQTQPAGLFITPNEVEAILNQAPTQTLVLADGKKLTLPNPDFTELQETLGPNGSSEVALALLERMKAALIEAGIDPETIIPELSFFSKTGHQVSDEQKTGERFLVEFAHPVDRKVADVIVSMSNYSHLMIRPSGFYAETELKHLAFQKGQDGTFLVSGTSEPNGQTNPNLKPISDFPVTDRLFYAGELAKHRLQTESNLRPLLPQFSTILETLTKNNNDLVYENRLRSMPFAGQFTNPTWLTTKVESNKACLLSKDKTCLR